METGLNLSIDTQLTEEFLKTLSLPLIHELSKSTDNYLFGDLMERFYLQYYRTIRITLQNELCNELNNIK